MELSKSNSVYSSISAPLEAVPSSRHNSCFNRHAGLLLSIPVALAAIFWSSQMIYFLFYFMSRPALPDGSWPRIGLSYAGWPFISCIGAIRQFCFKSVGITVAILLWTAFSIDYIIGRRSPVGKWWRLGKLVTASLSSVFLIALSFASTDSAHKLHLIFTSFQIICMAMSKACDWNLNRDMREHTPNNQYLAGIKVWKRAAATIAFPCGLLALIGIYACSATVSNGEVIFTPKCYSLVSLAAPAEWILAWCWVVFLGTVACDTYHLESTIRLLMTTPPPAQKQAYWLGLWKRRPKAYHESDYGVNRDELNELHKTRTAAEPMGNSKSGDQRGTRELYGKKYSAADPMEEDGENDNDNDVDAATLYDDVEIGLLPPAMPRSVLAGSTYQQVDGAPPAER